MTPARTPGAVLTTYAQILIKTKARQLCRRSGFGRSDEEDLVQELTLRLLEKEHLYDPSRGATLDTFADRVITSAVQMILRDRRRLKRAAGLTAISLDTTPVMDEGDPVFLIETVTDTDQQRVTLNRRDHLSDEDRALVREVVEGLPEELREVPGRMLETAGNISAVGRGRRVSRRQVYAALHRIEPHFTKAG